MCGIAGVADTVGTADRTIVERMLGALVHRGPDGEGVWAEGPVVLGNRRLAIVDLSDGGAQPMHDPEGRYVLTYNGEIYNHPELREELARAGLRCRSRSDTEVLLAAYAHWGPECLHRLNGMFAFAIYDRLVRRLFAARDRLGVKPFVYSWDGRRLAFASEHKALLEAGVASSTMAPEAVYEYIARGYVTGARSWYADLRALPPGHALTLDHDGSLATRRWWRPDAEPDRGESCNGLAEQVAQTLDDAVRVRLRSDVPVGVHLSGGLDSSAIAVAASRHAQGSLDCFTGAFPGGPATDERRFSREVTRSCGLRGHEVELDLDGLAASFQRLMWHLDEPTAGPGAYSQLAVCDLAAATGVKVTLGGQGGDELFGGYLRHRILHLRSSLRRGTVSARASGALALARVAVPELRRVHRTATRPRDEDLAPAFLDAVDPGFREEVRRRPLAWPDARTAIRWDLEHYLSALLHVDDRTTMAVSIEGRAPLLDHRLVELVLRIPEDRLLGNGAPKPLLREAVRSWLPAAVADRRDKRGFPTPVEEWRSAPRLRALVAELTTGARRRSDGTVFAERYLRRASSLSASRLWATLAVQGWLAGGPA